MLKPPKSGDIPSGSGYRFGWSDIPYNCRYAFCSDEIQPNHGFAILFTTGDGEKKYMRVYIKDYSLDSSGSLASVTIQYQLY